MEVLKDLRDRLELSSHSRLAASSAVLALFLLKLAILFAPSEKLLDYQSTVFSTLTLFSGLRLSDSKRQ
jgi:hypothetical protein